MTMDLLEVYKIMRAKDKMGSHSLLPREESSKVWGERFQMDLRSGFSYIDDCGYTEYAVRGSGKGWNINNI